MAVGMKRYPFKPGLRQVISSEGVKLRRSNAPWLTMVAASLAPAGIALFMWIVREPGRAAQLGLLGAKANLSGLTATWAAFGSMLTLIVGIGGMLLLPFVTAYLFGREYAEGTIKNMLGVPVRRHWFVVGKLWIALVWWLLLVALVFVEAGLFGMALGLPGLSWSLTWKTLGDVSLAALISYLLVPAVAWVTMVGRGYMLPVAFALAMMATGNILSRTGWAEWFPWSVVPSLVGVVGRPVAVPLTAYAVLGVTFAAGLAGAVWWLRNTDCNQ
jgi:ABC-type transport system involved in multi-copper enzyme maturation permease subunit